MSRARPMLSLGRPTTLDLGGIMLRLRFVSVRIFASLVDAIRTPLFVALVSAALSLGGAGRVVAAPLDHFLCYDGRRPALGLGGVGAVDRYGPSTITVRQAKRLCAPVNENGADPTAPSRPGHLSVYTIKQTAPHFRGPQKVSVRDQFGALSVELVRPERLLVPTAESLTGPPPPPLATPLDHYKCYRVRGARLRVPSITVETQFGPLVVAIERPRDLCVPVDANGAGVIDPAQGLMCYQVRTAPQQSRTVFTTDRFGSAELDLFGVRDLCVPLLAGPGTCGDGAIDAPGERCETGLGNDAACPGTCDTATCTCRGTSPVCGNGVVEAGEQCDGADAVACPGRCNVATCTCTPPSGPCDGQIDGTPCDDANACTATDTCQAGTCTGSAPVVCTASDQCHTAGTCNPATGTCSNPPKANGAVCNDANACTATDTCQAGTCTGSNPVTCPATQCTNAGTCNPATGACSAPPRADGTTCTDGSLCTTGDRCEAGICTGDSSCPACMATCQTTCDPATGACRFGMAPDGTVCGVPAIDDECALPSTCTAGGCASNAVPDGTPCGRSFDPQCSQASTCQGGRCLPGPIVDDTPCDDGNVCTLADACQGGFCTGRQRSCDDRQALNFDTCNQTTGLCEHAPDPTRVCPTCTGANRCCRVADGAGGFDTACVAGPSCEDETGTVGRLCTTTGGAFVCAGTCCGNDCCEANVEQCVAGQCIPIGATLCGDSYCVAGQQCVAGTCFDLCGPSQLRCGSGEQCCPALNKSCSNGQICGATDCAAPCGPGEVSIGGACCLGINACGAECCDFTTETCDTCSDPSAPHCVPRP